MLEFFTQYGGLIFGALGAAVAVFLSGMGSLNTPLVEGLYLFMAALPVGVVGYFSAVAQGKVSIAGQNILAKNSNESTKGIILAVMVETYAILGFAISFLLLQQITF